jgi:peptidoglycan hydrolase-like protein with peptidoglycan-binding domain
LKYDAFSTSTDLTGPGPEAQRAPGKQSLTERLVQRKVRGAALGAPDPTATAPEEAAATSAGDDPFALHLPEASLDSPEVVQQDGGGGGDPGLVRSAAAEGVRGAGGPMPFAAEIQASFGRAADVSQIQAHVGGPAADACEAMDASAYATGDRVAFASSPDLHTAAHEAAHVVQQAHGVNLYGGVGAAGDAYEQHADQVADRVVAGQSAEALLEDGPRAGGGGGGGGAGAGEGGAADEAAEDAELEAELDAEGPVQLRRRRGGGGGLAGKAQMLLQWRREMVEVARQVAGEFRPLGLTFRPQILLATAMQEAAPSNALTARSFDNGLGLMQITPYRGRLDPQVARAIGWDNSRGLAANIASSNWRSARANLLAGAYTMLTKARAIKRALPRVWEQMDEEHKWRAVLFAYNAGEGSAISALRRGGPNARMISTYTNPRGQRVSHDYTAEIAEKMDWVESHDPFGGEGGGRTPTADRDDDAGDADAGGGGGGVAVGGGERRGGRDDDRDDEGGASGARIGGSVGRGGRNRRADVRIVQSNLRRHGYHQVGRVDGVVGPKTRGAIEDFQEAVLGFVDGLIEVGRNTFDALFGEDPSPAGGRGGGGRGGGGRGGASAGATRRPARRPDASGDVETTGRHAPDGDEDRDGRDRQGDDTPDPPSYQAIAQGNFRGTIPGSNLTWHQALWLPSFSRHVRPSDVTNIGMDDLLANVARQAAALTAVASALGTSIVVHCWVRPPAYNRRIGGASNSAHLRGTATDFHCPGMTAEQVRRAVKSRHLYPGAGENNVSWVHLDLEHQRWFNP